MSQLVGKRDQGQNGLEYTGLVLLVAAVVAGIVAVGVLDQAPARLQSAICRVFTPEQGCGTLPQGRAPELTPLERATQGTYVALGDSYSSGGGGSEFIPGTDSDQSLQESVEGWIPFWENEDPHNLCHRSTEAYAQQVYDEYDFEGDLEFHACSGAGVEDLYTDETHSNDGEAPQLEHLDEDTSLVTVGIGGNDVGFADVVTECVKKGVMEWSGSCEESMGEETRQKIRDLKDDLVQLYNDIQERAPNARVVIVGYPRMFPDETNPPLEVGPSLEAGDLDEPIDPDDQQWMNDMAVLLNQTIEEATEEAGVEFVDPYDALDGHEIGAEDSWINDIDLEVENGTVVDMGSFHPNDRGQAAISVLVQEQIETGG